WKDPAGPFAAAGGGRAGERVREGGVAKPGGGGNGPRGAGPAPRAGAGGPARGGSPHRRGAARRHGAGRGRAGGGRGRAVLWRPAWRPSAGPGPPFLSGVGPGGTISGVARYPKGRSPDVGVVGADPEGSVLSGGSGKPWKVEGIGEDYVPRTFNSQMVDDWVRV